jgi:hypothetical protein
MTLSDFLTLVLATTGSLLGVVNLILSYWIHHDQALEKLKGATRVEEEVEYGEGTMSVGERVLVVSLVNVGRIPLFITSVELEGAATGAKVPLTLVTKSPQRHLAVGDGRDYALSATDLTADLGDVAKALRYQFWIRVHTPRGEVLHIDDPAFVADLRALGGAAWPSSRGTPGLSG